MKRKLESSFLFLAVVLLCSNDTWALSSLKISTTGICGDNPVEGAVAMKFGYDITNYNSKALSDSKKAEIFSYTCINNASVHLFDNENKTTFPDQFATPNKINQKFYDSTITISDHLEEFSREETTGLKTDEQSKPIEKIGEEVSNAALAAQLRWAEVISPAFKAVGSIIETLTPPLPKTVEEYSECHKNNKYQAGTSWELKLYDLAFKEDPVHFNLQDDFKRAYYRLPASFMDDPWPFHEFIGKYGTHYISSAVFGGRVKYTTTHTTTTDRTTEKKEIEKQYKNLLETIKDLTNTSSKVEKTIINQTVNAEVNGGDLWEAAAPNFASMQAWEKSVKHDPNPIKVNLVPIIYLIANKTIQTQLAIAIHFTVNKESLGRYRKLMEAIHKDNIPNSLPEFEKGYDFGKVFATNYAKQFDEVDGMLKGIPDKIYYILTMVTKSLHDKVNKLSILYENTKIIGNLWKEMNTYNQMYDAVYTLEEITTRCKYYERTPGTVFKGSEAYKDRFVAAKKLIKSLKNDDSAITERDGVTKASELFGLQETLYAVKGDNDKYLNSRTWDCDAHPKKGAITICYIATMCAVHLNMAGKGWEDNKKLVDYENETPAIKNLKTMLTTMQHRDYWEKVREIFQEEVYPGGWSNCEQYWPGKCKEF